MTTYSSASVKNASLFPMFFYSKIILEKPIEKCGVKFAKYNFDKTQAVISEST